MSELSVDTAHHVITDIRAYHADKKDNQYLQDIAHRLKKRLNQQGLLWHNLIADTGYSSGEKYSQSEVHYFFLEKCLYQAYKSILSHFNFQIFSTQIN